MVKTTNYKNIEEIPSELKNRKTGHAKGGTRVNGVYYNRSRNIYGILQWKGSGPLLMKIEPNGQCGITLEMWATESVEREDLGGGSVKHVNQKQPWKKALYLTLKLKHGKIVAQARADGKTRGCDHHKLNEPQPIRRAVQAQDKKLEDMGIDWHQRHTKGLHVHMDKKEDGKMDVLVCSFCKKRYNYQKRVQMHEKVCQSNPLVRSTPRYYCARKRRLSAVRMPMAKRQNMMTDAQTAQCKQEFAQHYVSRCQLPQYPDFRSRKTKLGAVDWLFAPVSKFMCISATKQGPSNVLMPWPMSRPGLAEEEERLRSLPPPECPAMVASRSNSRSPSFTPPPMDESAMLQAMSDEDQGGVSDSETMRPGSPMPLELPPAVHYYGAPIPPAIKTGFAPVPFAEVQLPKLPDSPFRTSLSHVTMVKPPAEGPIANTTLQCTTPWSHMNAPTHAVYTQLPDELNWDPLEPNVNRILERKFFG